MVTTTTPNPSLEEKPNPQALPGSIQPLMVTADVGNPPQIDETRSMSPEEKRAIIIAVLVGIILLVSIVVSIVWLMNQPLPKVTQIRDVFIIFMALMSLLTSASLVILLIQLARLINLLQNEIKPIVESTNETVSNLRGTTMFLSENMVGPVIKLNEYMAGFSQLLATVGLMRRTKRKNNSKGE